MAVNLFDPAYYRAANSDLARIGFSDAQLADHFQRYGLNEGRSFSPLVDLNTYRATNSDLRAFDNRSLYEHLRTYGVQEGRRFSSFVDLNYYRFTNSDLVRLNNEQLFTHLQTYGLDEQRSISADFRPSFYTNLYSDLQGLSTPRAALYHVTIYGLNEGRTFSPFIDLNYYRTNNPDLAQFKNRSALLHLEQYGFNEERTFSHFFDLNFYKTNNQDLRSFVGRQLFDHFGYFGLSESRPGRTDSVGNTLSTATRLPVSATPNYFFEFVGLSDSTDVYQFSLSAPGTFILVAVSAGSSSGLSFELLDRNGRVLQSSASPVFLLPSLQADTYYLRFQSSNSSNTNYFFNYAIV
jgi:hypothetical protein